MSQFTQFELLAPRVLLTGEATGLYADSVQLVVDFDQNETKPEILFGAQLNDEYLILANDNIGDYELWLTDGNTAKLIDEIFANHPQPPTPALGSHEAMRIIEDRVYLQLDFFPDDLQELWWGSGGKTQLWTATAEPGSAKSLATLGGLGLTVNYVTEMKAHNGDLLLQVLSTSNGDSTSGRIFLSDGTTEGTNQIGESLRVAFVNPMSELIRLNETWYFLGGKSVGETTFGLFAVDLAAAELILVKQFNGNVFGEGNPRSLTVVGDSLYFFADGGEGFQFWQSDGTTAGTIPNADPDIWEPPTQSSSPQFTQFDGRPVSAKNNELLIGDPTESNVFFSVPTTNASGNPFALVGSPEDLFFLQGESGQLHRLRGSEIQTLSDVPFRYRSGVNGNWSSHLRRVGDSLFAFAGDGLHRFDNVTGESHVFQKDFVQGSVSSTSSEETMYFAYEDGKRFELWRVGETLELLSDFEMSSFSNGAPLVEYVGERLFFQPTVWDSDNLRVFNFETGEVEDTPLDLVVAVHALADDTVVAVRRLGTTVEIWSSIDNGEFEQETTINTEITAIETATLDGFLFFGDDAGNLWKTNGTDAGTEIIYSFPLSEERLGCCPEDVVSNLFSDGETLFFAANDGENGKELWLSDGTHKGTQLAIDIRPGETSSWPSNPTVSGDKLYFVANDGKVGHEIWSVDFESPRGPSPGSMEERLAGDTNEDGTIDFTDFLVLSSNFGKQLDSGHAAGDFNDDSVVDFEDFLMLSDNYASSLTT